MDNTISQTDMTAEEFFNGLFNLDFMTEEEKQTIYQGAELFAKGKVHQASLQTPSNVRWVKASERLPETSGKYYCKTFAHIKEIIWLNTALPGWDTLFKRDIAEWLDESTPIPIQTPCVELEKEVERLKGLIWEMYGDMGTALNIADEFIEKEKNNFKAKHNL